MVAQFRLGSIPVDVTFKDIRNVHLSVHPPTGRVTVSAPARMNLETIRVFAITKLAWIKRQQRKLKEQPRETPREYLGHESHYLWGRRYLLTVAESDDKPSVAVRHRQLHLRVPKDATVIQKHAIMSKFYRDQARSALSAVLTEWAPILDVTVDKVHVQRMKTKWGSANAAARSIRLNTELVKKPLECFEYVVVHEMAHLIEPTHNARFVSLMDRVMPNWRIRRGLLNQLPVCHEDWAT